MIFLYLTLIFSCFTKNIIINSKILIDEHTCISKIKNLLDKKYDFYIGFNNNINYTSDFTKKIFFNNNLLYLENINNLNLNHIGSVNKISIKLSKQLDVNILCIETDYPEIITIYKYLYLMAIKENLTEPHLFIFECRRETIDVDEIYILCKSIFNGNIKYNDSLDQICKEKLGIITDLSIFDPYCIVQ